MLFYKKILTLCLFLICFVKYTAIIRLFSVRSIVMSYPCIVSWCRIQGSHAIEMLIKYYVETTPPMHNILWSCVYKSWPKHYIFRANTYGSSPTGSSKLAFVPPWQREAKKKNLLSNRKKRARLFVSMRSIVSPCMQSRSLLHLSLA